MADEAEPQGGDAPETNIGNLHEHSAWQQQPAVKAVLDASAAAHSKEEQAAKDNSEKPNSADSGPPRETPVFVTKEGAEVTHMDLLRSAIELDARRERLRNGTASAEEVAAYEAAKKQPKQLVPYGFVADVERDLLTTTESGVKPGENPVQPVGSTRDLNGKELVQQNLPKTPNAGWSSQAQEEPEKPGQKWGS